MKVLRNILIALSLVVVSNAVLAAGYVTGKITTVRVDANGNGIAMFSTVLTTPSACVSTTYNNMMAFNTNTAGGRSMLAAMLFAQGKGNTVSAVGTGACGVYGGSIEDMLLMQESN
jgi:hypothetical protein